MVPVRQPDEWCEVRAADDEPVVVCYIAGAGRSGSTILNILLGNHPAAVNVGELRQLSQVIRNGELCSCGVPVASCEWWSKVILDWTKTGSESFKLRGEEEGLLDTLAKAQQRFERTGSTVRSGWKKNSEPFAEYAALTRSLLVAIRRAADGGIVVDSSKTAARALALARIEGVDLRVIHLVRDPRGYAWSLGKSFTRDRGTGIEKEIPSRGALGAVASWILANLLGSRLVKRLDSRKTLVLRYEDMMNSPRKSLEQIGALLGKDFSGLASSVTDAPLQLAVGHTLAGNRLRMRANLKLCADYEWRERMSPRDRRRITRLAGWLMKKYHYED